MPATHPGSRSAARLPSDRTVVIGAGPAGLAAAHGVAEHGRPAVVFERDGVVGGIARTVEHRGYRFDLGGHRFFTKVEEVDRLWRETLGDDFLLRSRLSRIHYRGRFFHYPLRPLNALTGLGPVESARVLASYAKAQLFPGHEETTFEQWVVHRFGRRLFEIFFQTYTEKVWGIPCSEITADWAAQRIKNLDLLTAVKNALLGGQGGDGEIVTSLIDRFHYPRLGPGMMWERWRDRLAGDGVETVTDAEVVRLHWRNGRVIAADVRHGDREERVEGAHFVSTMPLRDLIAAMEPAPPPAVVDAARRLRYRDFLIVVLIVRKADLFPDNWIYVHSPEVRAGRIQNFKNWSPDMVPDPATSSLGMEYFLSREEAMWSADDDELVALGRREAAALGLVDPTDVRDGTVVRVPDAYPVYDRETAATVATLRTWLGGLENLYPIGRNGQHRYNNQDHSMVTGLHAARTIAGSPRPIWDVNVESAYHEEVTAGQAADGDRRVPGEARPGSLEAVLERAFARYDPLALGVAVGTVAAAGLLLVTLIALLRGGAAAPPLSLLSNYLFSYALDWRGLVTGTLEAGLVGFLLGAVAAAAINRLVDWTETVLVRELEALGTLDPLTREGA